MTDRKAVSAGDPLRHSPLEDAAGLATGIVLASLGVHILTSAELVTGQTAGLAVLVSYAAEMPFGVVFFAVNLPFYAIAVLRMGWSFTLRTLLAVTGMSVGTTVLPWVMPLGPLEPWSAGIIASTVTSVGLIVLFRHRASLGGIGILALFLQERTGFRAGWTQLIFDAGLFAAAFLVIAPWLVLASAAGAAVLNVLIAFNHRTDRYIAR
ncbi:MAG: YitT family protein [Pseudomonadota bacterium]